MVFRNCGKQMLQTAPAKFEKFWPRAGSLIWGLRASRLNLAWGWFAGKGFGAQRRRQRPLLGRKVPTGKKRDRRAAWHVGHLTIRIPTEAFSRPAASHVHRHGGFNRLCVWHGFGAETILFFFSSIRHRGVWQSRVSKKMIERALLAAEERDLLRNDRLYPLIQNEWTAGGVVWAVLNSLKPRLAMQAAGRPEVGQLPKSGETRSHGMQTHDYQTWKARGSGHSERKQFQGRVGIRPKRMPKQLGQCYRRGSSQQIKTVTRAQGRRIRIMDAIGSIQAARGTPGG